MTFYEIVKFRKSSFLLEQDTEIRCQIFDRSQPEFPLRLLPDRAFETLTAPDPGRSLMLMRVFRHNSSEGSYDRDSPGTGNNSRADQAPPVLRARPDRPS